MQKFGITEETKSSNSAGYDKGGFHKATLQSVSVEEVGKNEKYTVLSFKFLDHEGIKTFVHSEFMVSETDENADKKIAGMNTRIKHIWEAFRKELPTDSKGNKGLGTDATSFEDFFRKIAEAFNTKGHEGTPIYKNKEGKFIPVWIKLGYYGTKGNIGFPLSPNFIERLTESNIVQPKVLTINLKYDKIEQTKPASNVPGQGIHGGINTGSDENEF